MEKPKFCVDCRWHISKQFDHGVAHACTHPVSFEDKGVISVVDLVTGEETDVFDRTRMCGTMREFDMCGPDAKLWEAKEIQVGDLWDFGGKAGVNVSQNVKTAESNLPHANR